MDHTSQTQRGTEYYSVEVGMATHDDLQSGNVETETVWVAILASSVHCETDAILLACQFAHSLSRNGGMPTSARLLNWPT
jgi:hypothetical protein